MTAQQGMVVGYWIGCLAGFVLGVALTWCYYAVCPTRSPAGGAK